MHHKCSAGYCLKKKDITGSIVCRFRFPLKYHGFEPKYENDVNVDPNRNITCPDKDKILISVTRRQECPTYLKQLVNARSIQPVPLGASFFVRSERELSLARNHPDLVRHIPELLSIWRANMESQAVVSWTQLIDYILKYALKPEERSTTLTDIIRRIGNRLKDDAPVK